MTEKVYRVAIVGLGRMGSTIDAEMPEGYPPYSVAAACAASPRFEVVAGADIDAAKRDAFRDTWQVDALYDDYQEMMRQEQPDLVAVCTRGVLHSEMGVAVAEAGVPMLYLEKAIGCSLRECDAVRDAVNANGTVFNTGVLRRFNKTYHQARDLIANEIGDLVAAVHLARTNVLHGHVHSIDTLSFLMGDPAIVSVWGELTPRDLTVTDNRLDKDPNGIFEIEFANGVRAASVPGGVWEFEVIGTQGSVRVLNNGQANLLRKAGGGRNVWEEVAVPELPRHSVTLSVLEDLADAYEEKRPALGHVDVTHHVTEACFAIVESHRQQQRVSLPLADRDLYVFHV